MKQVTTDSKKYVPYGINGEYFIYDNEENSLAFGLSHKRGSKKFIQKICDEMNGQETASSNDSLEDRKIVAETSELVDFASAFNDVTNTPILAGYVDSKFEDTKLCLVFGRNRDQVKERMNLICEAVNNYNALKQSNKELIEALGSAMLALEPLARKTPDGWDKPACVDIFKTVKSALQKAKQL